MMVVEGGVRIIGKGKEIGKGRGSWKWTRGGMVVEKE